MFNGNRIGEQEYAKTVAQMLFTDNTAAVVVSFLTALKAPARAMMM